MNRFAGLRPHMGPADAFDIFRRELDMAWQEGGIFQLTMHPHYSGYRSRIWVLEELIRHAKARGSVWFATHADIVRFARDNPTCFSLRHGRAERFEERRRFARLCPGDPRLSRRKQGVDARDMPAHDEEVQDPGRLASSIARISFAFARTISFIASGMTTTAVSSAK